MARARNIKPGFFSNEHLAELDFCTRLLFIGLWTEADREGRLEDRPKRLKMALFPADNVDVESMLDALAGQGFIRRYQVGEVKAIQIVNWAKHQNPHMKEAPSTIPCEHSASTMLEQDQHSSSPADSLIPDSLNLIPDSLTLSQAPDAPSQESLFDQFWKLYPRKTAKAKACREWLKIKPDQALFAKIMEALATHAASRDWLKDGGQFIPHPSTWLHQKRWEDELMPSNVHPLPSRHNGFEGRNYRDGLTERGDGTYDF